MKCPHCSVDLMMTERKSIEIDYCPKCRGVWLDRGELDKLIDSGSADERYGQRSQESRSRDDRHHDKGYYKKRGGWLKEIFDFD